MKYIAVVLFIVAYIATIPVRGYEFLDRFVDTTQGVTIWMHLTLIVAGIIVLVVGLKILEIIVKKFILDKSHKKK